MKIPKNVQEAIQVLEWQTAISEEMKALEKNHTGEVMGLPKGKTTVGCKWVFTVKYNSDGSLERYKARLVAKGFTQTYGIDYLETFAPVAKLNTVRVLLSIAANLDWPLQQLDVKNAFLNGNLEEEVYVDPPPGFDEHFGSKVCKLKKSLYGLKQSPRAWFERFTQSVKNQGYVEAQSDHTMFIKHSNDGKIAILIVYVDDIILTGDNVTKMDRLKKSLALEFEIKDLESLKYFLGMEVARSKKGIVVLQRKYILDLLKETRMSGCRPVDTPIDPNQKLGDTKDGNPMNTTRYQNIGLSTSEMAAVEADDEEDLLAFEKDPYQRMSTNGTSNSSSWTREQDKAFENALAIISEESSDRWEKVAAMVPGKTVEEIKHHYEILVEDINAIESDLVPLPHYKDSTSRAGDFGVGEEGSQFGQMQSDSRHGGKSSRSDQERRRGIAWTEEEHRLFLLGLEKYGKGDWKGISRNFVVSRTPTQVASHAQKYFIRQSSANRERRRTSIHDITSVCGGDTSSTPQGQITGQVDGVATMAKPTLSDPHLISAVGVPVDHPSLAEMLSDVRAPTPGSLVSGTSKDMPPMTYLQPHSSDQK
ncbi:unnamed protein product [Camellia sinensis]